MAAAFGNGASAIASAIAQASSNGRSQAFAEAAAQAYSSAKPGFTGASSWAQAYASALASSNVNAAAQAIAQSSTCTPASKLVQARMHVCWQLDILHMCFPWHALILHGLGAAATLSLDQCQTLGLNAVLLADGGDAQKALAVAKASAFASGSGAQAIAQASAVAIANYGCSPIQSTLAGEPPHPHWA